MINDDFLKGFFSIFNPFAMNVLSNEEDKPNSTCKYKFESYVDGKLKERVEKVWENGKLIENSCEANLIEDKDVAKESTECCCDCQENSNNKCCCDKEENKETSKLEEIYVRKLNQINEEVDGLAKQLDESFRVNDQLIAENKALREQLTATIEKNKGLKEKLDNLKNILG